MVTAIQAQPQVHAISLIVLECARLPISNIRSCPFAGRTRVLLFTNALSFTFYGHLCICAYRFNCESSCIDDKAHL
jgi:hypothetical protein